MNNTFDFSSQKSKKNWFWFSRTFHMESPLNKTLNWGPKRQIRAPKIYENPWPCGRNKKEENIRPVQCCVTWVLVQASYPSATFWSVMTEWWAIGLVGVSSPIYLKGSIHNIFTNLAPLGRVGHRVAMSVCLSVCLCVCAIGAVFFSRGISLALRSHDQIPASH